MDLFITQIKRGETVERTRPRPERVPNRIWSVVTRPPPGPGGPAPGSPASVALSARPAVTPASPSAGPLTAGGSFTSR